MNVSSNIWKLYTIKASKWLMLFMPIIWPFYRENGLSKGDMFWIQGIYSITIAVIEIPSGYVADVLGRKRSMIVGTFFGCVGIAIYAFSYSFSGFLSAALCLGFGQSFISGSDTALMYDSLLEMNREKDFIKLEGRTISIGNFAEAIAGFIGAYFLTGVSNRTPFYYQIPIFFIGFVISFLLVEPDTPKMKGGKVKPWKNIQSIIKYSLIENSTLRLNIFYSSIIGVSTLTIAWFIQPWLDTIGVPERNNGLIIGILNLSVAFAAFYSHYIERVLNTKIILLSILFFICGSYFAVGHYLSLWSLGIFLIFYFTRGVATPVLRDYMNRLTPSEMRATVMSIRSFIIRAMFGVMAPIIGYVIDVYSIKEALFLSGIIFFILGGITLIFLIRSLRSTNH